MKEQSTSRGFAILSAAGIIVKLMSLIYMFILIRLIGSNTYAVYTASYVIFVFVYMLINSGIPATLSKFVAELIAVNNYKDAVKTFKIARFILLIAGTILSLLMIFTAGFVSNAIHFNEARLSLIVLAPTVLFTSIASTYRGYFQGRGSMKPTAVSQIIEQAVNIVFSLTFAYAWRSKGVEYACAGATVGTTVGALVSAIYLVIICEKTRALKFIKSTQEIIYRYTNKQLLRRLLAYGVPISLCWGLQYSGSIVDMANTKTRLLYAGFSNLHANLLYANLGKYQILINVPITIISALCAAILPMISKYHATEDKEGVKRGINYSFRSCMIIAVPSAVGLAALSYPIFEMIFPGNRDGAFLMEIGAVVIILMSLVQIQSTILQSIGKFYLATFYIVIGIVIKILINYYFIAIPNININGAILGTIVGYSIPLYFNSKLIKKSLKINYSLLRKAAKPFIASLAMGIIAFTLRYLLGLSTTNYILNSLFTLISMFVGISVYAFIIIYIGGIRKGDLNWLPRKINKYIAPYLK